MPKSSYPKISETAKHWIGYTVGSCNHPILIIDWTSTHMKGGIKWYVLEANLIWNFSRGSVCASYYHTPSRMQSWLVRRSSWKKKKVPFYYFFKFFYKPRKWSIIKNRKNFFFAIPSPSTHRQVYINPLMLFWFILGQKSMKDFFLKI